jgi:serine O-acetyltransferase
MATFDITGVVQALHDARQQWRQAQSRNSEAGNREFPSRDALADIIDRLKGVLFPMRLGPPDLRQESEDFHVAHALDAALHALLHQVKRELAYNAASAARLAARWRNALAAVRAFAAALPSIRTCSTATCWPPTRATRPRAAWTKCCCAIRACWR